MKDNIIRIKAVGKVAWDVCGILLVTIILLYATEKSGVETTNGDVALFLSGIGGATAVATLGSALVPAVAIGIREGLKC